MSDVNRLCLMLVAISALAATGCTDVSWPSQRYISTVRVLGVQAEPPTLEPGATTHLSVHCADGRGGSRTAPDCDVEVAWFGQCNNPLDNDPSNCFAQYAAWAESLSSPIGDTPIEAYPEGFGFGRSLDFAAPSDILAAEVEIAEYPIRYGVSYVYFAVCAGRIVPASGSEDRLPIECRDRETNQPLDQRSMVVGMTAIYSYDLVRSKNPVLHAPHFDGVSILEDCATQPCPSGFECAADGQCVPVVAACQEKGSDACRPHCLMFTYSADSFTLLAQDGTRIDEPKKSVWADYYTNAGYVPWDDAHFGLGAPSEPDGVKGTPCVQWGAPAYPTEHAHIWTVVRDNRGGLSVHDQRVIVR